MNWYVSMGDNPAGPLELAPAPRLSRIARIATIAGVIAGVAAPVAIALVALAPSTGDPAHHRVVVPQVAFASHEPVQPKPASALEQIVSAETLGSALVLARPLMDDKPDQQSAGTILLTLWAMKRMDWVDVSVAKDETTFALVQKDVDEQRGKRMCVRGVLVQIAAEQTPFGIHHSGLLLSYSSRLYSFLGVGSSGPLVERSGARFCGVVTGKYDYSNDLGGTGHAIVLVGMFDLPDNRPENRGARLTKVRELPW
jgi:hypothetical protein